MMIFTFESTKSSKNKNGQLKNRATKKPVCYTAGALICCVCGRIEFGGGGREKD
jgi:hypothetical protein